MLRTEILVKSFSIYARSKLRALACLRLLRKPSGRPFRHHTPLLIIQPARAVIRRVARIPLRTNAQSLIGRLQTTQESRSQAVGLTVYSVAKTGPEMYGCGP